MSKKQKEKFAMQAIIAVFADSYIESTQHKDLNYITGSLSPKKIAKFKHRNKKSKKKQVH